MPDFLFHRWLAIFTVWCGMPAFIWHFFTGGGERLLNPQYGGPKTKTPPYLFKKISRDLLIKEIQRLEGLHQ